MSVSRVTQIDWLLFVLLGFFWGSSYLFIKIGVDSGLQPFTLVTLRLVVGFALLALVVVALRVPLPHGGRTYGHLVVLGFFAVALPFFLITWAEQSVDSALAATLTAPVPLFVIPIAALMLRDERMTVNKVVGVSVGMIGVAVLVGFDISQLGRTDLTPQLALLVATVSYALGGVYARRFVHGLRPMIPAMFQVFFAMLMSAVAAILFEDPIGQTLGLPLEAIIAVVWLGLLGSGMAYLLFYRLLGRWGPTRVSLVAYTLPIWGIALGWLVLREQIHEGLVLGTALVIGGIALVNNAHLGLWRRIARASLEQGR
ncbi:MAG TPA: DMT family transporter [Candidatus Limnocylindrales bacterium]|jgi:drug/metabolite transporter (DMT)-like permease|nr:DMT family transporter [Candidatus Limnocylindrales bacterium]